MEVRAICFFPDHTPNTCPAGDSYVHPHETTASVPALGNNTITRDPAQQESNSRASPRPTWVGVPLGMLVIGAYIIGFGLGYQWRHSSVQAACKK